MDIKNSQGAAKLISVFMLMTFGVMLGGCGTTSTLQPADAASGDRIDLSSYQHAVISDFSDAATAAKKFKKDEKGEAQKAAYQADVQAAGVTFSEYLQAELIKLKVFESVQRGDEAGEGSLLIGGDITRFERGNAAAKFLIGLGAGSTYFDATVNVSDGLSGEKLGEIIVDKNSWVLGGAISASQNVESFMRGGAEKAAKELYIARFGEEPVN